MYKIYLKQALALWKDNKVLTLVSALGTALAISMIMVIVLVWQIRTANYAPETKRDRTLYVYAATARGKEDANWNSSAWLGYKTIKECFYPIPEAEAVTAVALDFQRLAALPDHTVEFKTDVTYTDAAFWKVFDFHFLQGQPYTEEEVQSGLTRAVISESTARRLYGSTDVVGKEILLSYVPYRICAVVKDVSMLAQYSYGNVWLPFSSDPEVMTPFEKDDLLGYFHCYMLAKHKADIPKIQARAQENVKRLNTTTATFNLLIWGAPDTHFVQLAREDSFAEPDISGTVTRYTLIILILLLIPSINLSGITLSRMQKRMAEIGVRKAFGARRGELMRQILYENFLLTLAGGCVGFLFSYLGLLLLKDWLLTPSNGLLVGESFLSADMLFNPLIFCLAFAFCLIMNLLSAGIPAWRASGKNIVNALNEN